MTTSDAHRVRPAVAVVTVGFDSDQVLPAFLDSLSEASSAPLAIVIADNKGHSPATAEIAARAHAEYLPLPDNGGYGSAVNAAVRRLAPETEWILVSNPDIVLDTDAVDRLVDAGRRDPEIGAVGPRLHNPDGSVYPSARAIPSVSTGIGHALLASVWTTNPWTRRYRGPDVTDLKTRNVGWLSGACFLIRASAFETVGGFDEAYFMYFEDVDLGYRLGKAGFRNVYLPTASVTHEGAHSTASNSALMTRAHHTSARLFLRRRYPGPLWAPVRFALDLGLSVRSALTAPRPRKARKKPRS